MEDFKETLQIVGTHGYIVKELPGVTSYSEEQKRNFLVKQMLMRIAAGIGEIATLSEPETIQTPECQNLLKESITKLFINTLRLAKSQNLDEEQLCMFAKRLIPKT